MKPRAKKAPERLLSDKRVVFWRQIEPTTEREVAATIRDHLSWRYLFRRPSIEEILSAKGDIVSQKWGIHPNTMRLVTEELEFNFGIAIPSEYSSTHKISVQRDITLEELLEIARAGIWTVRHLEPIAESK